MLDSSALTDKGGRERWVRVRVMERGKGKGGRSPGRLSLEDVLRKGESKDIDSLHITEETHVFCIRRSGRMMPEEKMAPADLAVP